MKRGVLLLFFFARVRVTRMIVVFVVVVVDDSCSERDMTTDRDPREGICWGLRVFLYRYSRGGMDED